MHPKTNYMMKSTKLILLTLLCLMVLGASSQSLEKGVSKELAEQRKANISNVRYDLTFNIPTEQKGKVTGKAVITFNLRNKTDVVLDFEGKMNGDFLVGKKKRKVSTKNNHIIVPTKFLKPGPVSLTVEFTTPNDALVRNSDYLFTRFVANQASSVFPCFDQPDLKATFTTRLNVPEGWKTIICNADKPISATSFSFVTGDFLEKTDTREGYKIRTLYRETDPIKVQQLEKIIDETAQSLKWMESYTGIKCPFKEYGLVILPSYQLGCADYLGFILLDDQHVFLRNAPTKQEELSRTEFMAHETAHLWFGSMVSLKNPEEEWAEEILTNFMASKITRRQYAKADYDLNFIRTCQTQAMAVDRTEGTHPIAMPPDKLDHTTMLNDPIVYNKSAVTMRMLEEIMGATNMQNGIRRFLRDHYLKEASWDDLIDALDKEVPTASVRQFSEVWVKQKGMPLIHTSYKDGQLIVSQTDPYERGLCWRQKFDVFIINNLGTSRTIHVDMQQPTQTYKLREKPSFIIPNNNGQGYGRFTLDDDYTARLPLRLITTRNDLNRYMLLNIIHESYLMGKVNPSHFGELYRLMMKEKNPLIMSTAIDHMFKIAFDMTPSQRNTLELCMMDLLGENKTKECRQIIIRKLATNMTSPDVIRQIYDIWNKHSETIFDDHDYMDMAYRLAMVWPDSCQSILDRQRSRLQTDDLKKEFDFVSRACNPNENKRNDLFNSLLKPQNRQQEPWALHTLDLLCSDIYEPENFSYIAPSLKYLQDIQQSSGIFFPGNWMNTLLAHHKSVLAKQPIEEFLASDKKMPEYLRNKVLEAAWILMKQQPYVEKEKPAVVTKPKATKGKTAPKKTATKKTAAKKK